MAQEAIAQSTEDKFDESVDVATDAVMAEFEWLGLPDTLDQRGDLMVQINDAIAAIMRDWL